MLATKNVDKELWVLGKARGRQSGREKRGKKKGSLRFHFTRGLMLKVSKKGLRIIGTCEKRGKALITSFVMAMVIILSPFFVC
jgi:hypothetical protein